MKHSDMSMRSGHVRAPWPYAFSVMIEVYAKYKLHFTWNLALRENSCETSLRVENCMRGGNVFRPPFIVSRGKLKSYMKRGST